MRTGNVSLISALIYTGISLIASISFFMATQSYNLVARAGGAAWVFILAMIILMPVVTPLVKRRYRV